MKKRLSFKAWVFLIFFAIFAVIYGFVFMKLTAELRDESLAEFRVEMEEAIEEEPNFLEEAFDIPNDTELTDEKLEELKPIAMKKAYLGIALMGFFIALLIYIVTVVPIAFFILPIFTSNHAFKKYKLNKDDFNKSKDYFRDVLYEYNPSELSYIDDFKIDKNTLIADLLMLENKKVITYENGVFKKNKEQSGAKLNSIEKYLLNFINDKGSNVIKIDYLSYIEKIKSCCAEHELIEKKEFPKWRFIVEAIVSILIYIAVKLLIFDFSLLEKIEFTNPFLGILAFTLLVFGIMTVMFYPMYFIVKHVILYIRLQTDNYVRTNKGDEINKKLEGLKIFIRDFSILEGREKKELILWKEYLIYSVVFNINRKVIDEYKDSVKF